MSQADEVSCCGNFAVLNLRKSKDGSLSFEVPAKLDATLDRLLSEVFPCRRLAPRPQNPLIYVDEVTLYADGISIRRMSITNQIAFRPANELIGKSATQTFPTESLFVIHELEAGLSDRTWVRASRKRSDRSFGTAANPSVPFAA